MPKFSLNTGSFTPHPEGRHNGVIADVTDEGMQDGPYGVKHKLRVIVVSQSAKMDDGRGFVVSQWLTLSGSTRANLTKWRVAANGGKKLTDKELSEFDTDELIGKRISYKVEHFQKTDGSLGYGIASGSVEEVPSDEALEQDAIEVAEAYREGVKERTARQSLGADEEEEDDLPF